MSAIHNKEREVKNTKDYELKPGARKFVLPKTAFERTILGEPKPLQLTMMD